MDTDRIMKAFKRLLLKKSIQKSSKKLRYLQKGLRKYKIRRKIRKLRSTKTS